MQVREINTINTSDYNKVVTHPLQSYEWGEFRRATGIKVIRRGFYKKGKLVKGFTLTIHKIPKTPFAIGYMPKGNLPSKELIEELVKIGRREKCIFIQLEPNVIKNTTFNFQPSTFNLHPAAHPLFTKYTFVLDLTKTEEELLKSMHSKARYNIKVASKHGVQVLEDNSEKAFSEYLKLMNETTTRQKFYAHTDYYHKIMRLILNNKMINKQMTNEKLTTHLLTAKYQNKILTAWMLFVFKDTLYYPYGASSSKRRELMPGNLMMWEAIRFGKKLGLKKFDLWGALGPDPDPKDSWYGFHSFKQKYGPEHIEFIGSYDLIINPVLYQAYKIADKIRWLYLKLKK